MGAFNTAVRWGWLAQAFHWLVFLLILGAWFAVDAHEDYPKESIERAQWMMIHKSLGASVFLLVWIRLGLRLAQVTPAELGSRLQRLAARSVHAGLYLVMIGMPLTGLLASQFFGREVSWFGLFGIPVVLEENRPLAKDLMEVHFNLFGLLLFLLFLHIGGALYHHFIARDDVLRRMLPWR